MYAMVYYLDCRRRKIEAEEDGIEKKQNWMLSQFWRIS